MATYAIGDIQGCYHSLIKLLKHINFNKADDKLWFTGDLVNRGPKSLEVIRFVKSLENIAITVLGNHDLHLLAIYYGKQSHKSSDTLDDILNAKDCNDLIEWLCQQPLIHYDPNLDYCLVHAGLLPQWTLENAIQYADEVSECLAGNQRQDLLAHMYGDKPDIWNDSLVGFDRYRIIINAFTRLRYLTPDNNIVLNYKGDFTQKSTDYIPWFDMPQRQNKNIKIIFGHWASLYNHWDVVTQREDIFPLDSGCVWGNCLSALRLEDKKRFSVSCQ